MFKNILSKVGWGELPSTFGFTVGEKVELPYRSIWDLHKATKKSDGTAASIFICAKKDRSLPEVAAAQNAAQMGKSLRHPNVLKVLDHCEVDSGVYLATEEVTPLLAEAPPQGDDERVANIWGLYQAWDALGFLHTSGITHGLFGPASVFVTVLGDYRLGGFDQCRKDAEVSSLLTYWRNSGPAIQGWPEPPAALARGGAASISLDLWGAAVMACYVFASATSAQVGVNLRLDLGRASDDLPQELRRPVAELQNVGPLRGRAPIAELLELPILKRNAAVDAMSFLSSLHIKSPEEKDAFFESLPQLLDNIPKNVQTKRLLSELLVAQRFPGQEAAHVLPSILKIARMLPNEEFKEKVAPLVVQLFSMQDRAVRFRLLTSIGDMIQHLDDTMVNDKIFPECVNGFTDSNAPIREATVKSLVFFVPRLRAKVVESRVIRLLLKLLQDPEASIRTNAVICCGLISSHLPAACATSTLTAALTAGLKDPFGPCRIAALHTLTATVASFPLDDLANRMMPAVCQRLVDPDASVSDTAFEVLGGLQQSIRQQVEKRRAEMAELHMNSGEASLADSAKEATQKGSWGSWAMTTVGSLALSKMGSMRSSGEQPAQQPAQLPSPPSADASPAASMGSSGTGAPFSMGMGDSTPTATTPARTAPPQRAQTAPIGVGSSAAANSNSTTAGGAPSARGMNLKPKATNNGTDAAKAAPKAVVEEDFWGEFGDLDECAEALASNPGTPATKRLTAPAVLSSPAARSTPAAGKSSTVTRSAPTKAVVDSSDEDMWNELGDDPLPAKAAAPVKAAPVKAAPAPAAVSRQKLAAAPVAAVKTESPAAPAKGGDAEDADFWKEFDM